MTCSKTGRSPLAAIAHRPHSSAGFWCLPLTLPAGFGFWHPPHHGYRTSIPTPTMTSLASIPGQKEERWRKDALLQHLCTERDLPLTCPPLPISRRPSASLAGTGSQGHGKYLTQRRLGTLPPRPHWGFASREDGSLTGAGPVSAAETMPLSGLCSCSLSLWNENYQTLSLRPTKSWAHNSCVLSNQLLPPPQCGGGGGFTVCVPCRSHPPPPEAAQTGWDAEVFWSLFSHTWKTPWPWAPARKTLFLYHCLWEAGFHLLSKRNISSKYVQLLNVRKSCPLGFMTFLLSCVRYRNLFGGFYLTQQFQPADSSAPHEWESSLHGSCQGASGFPQGFLIRQVLKTKSSSPLVLILVFFAQWLTRRCGICWHPRGLS